ncbi:hypothetical protein [Fimbriimonas ginsengisoli]|uniref:SGNH/GDSL hydrolase family protein n=1 Tax=Fimbriimonas ginsengisoli Gsoil 348 TaxID=661478 RepID=A0A068NRS0_FIMGI|nr:hypothetical protein [Fimbriimonas ginsengisoli]AIE86116.1 hypothetical protein OP10G_2748 [Fimbriimonas ginsengisoli Gsoil 348]
MLLALLLAAPHTLRILFVGNSLLHVNEVPATVANMLQSDGNGTRVAYKNYFVGHLEDVPPGSEIAREVGSGRYDIVVLQSAMVSSSLTRNYAQTRGIAMAKDALAHRARVLLYVEWPRRGVDETEYTMNVYRGIAKASGAEIVPVCYAWNWVHQKAPNAPLWNPDGNHALPSGSFVAAACLYSFIAGIKATPTYRPAGVDSTFASLALLAGRRSAIQP